MLDYIGRTLELRVAASLKEKMPDEKREEFEQISDLGDTPARLWLERNFSDYVNIADQEFDNLCADIRSVAADILNDEGITDE